MPGIVEVPVATKQQAASRIPKQNGFDWSQAYLTPQLGFQYPWMTDKKVTSVFDEPIDLMIPRALLLLFLWTFWTFAWSSVTQVGLSDEYKLPGNVTLGYWDYWQYAVMHVTNIGANDINPVSLTGRIWLALYALFTVAFLYALISTL